MSDAKAGRTVLVVDEDLGVRTVLARVFERSGYTVVEAQSDEEAGTAAREHSLAAVVADMMTLGLSGKQLVRWSSQFGPSVGLVFVTSSPSYGSAVAAVRCHADDYLEKPFNHVDDAVAAVHAAIERRTRVTRAAGPKPNSEAQEEDLRSRFLSALAHELRTPITVIKAFAWALKHGAHGDVNDDQTQVLDKIELETSRLAYEIDKLLNLARLEDDDFEPSLGPVPVSELLPPVERALLSQARQNGIQLVLLIQPPGARVMADARDIRRALMALAENAMKFSAEGGRITLSAVLESGSILFAVEDKGIGMDPAAQDRIFDIFVQLEDPLTRRAGGVGIGLTLAARVLEAHNTKIEVESRRGHGTRISFRLPAAPMGEHTEPPQPWLRRRPRSVSGEET